MIHFILTKKKKNEQTKELGAGGERIATSSLALDALLAIAHKSLCVDLHLRGMLKAGVQRADRFPQETTDLIGDLNEIDENFE